MKLKNSIYKPFDKFVFRSPLISFDEFEKNLLLLDRDDSYWVDFLKKKDLKEAIFLGSPILYNEIRKYINKVIPSQKDKEKFKTSILRYYTRMSTRCTPFGLFAGVSLGQLGDESKIILTNSNGYRRHTRLDMDFLCNLIQKIESTDSFRRNSKYYPNNSIYILGNKIRYIEYDYKNTRRTHKVSEVDYSDYLAITLQRASFGATIQELSSLLMSDNISAEESAVFINELIDSKLLYSELAPRLTGEDILTHIQQILKKYPKNGPILEILDQIKLSLGKLDSESKKSFFYYERIENAVKKLDVDYNINRLFQTDLYKPTHISYIKKQWVENIENSLIILYKLTSLQKESTLSKFARKFHDRFENREMPLLHALDPENGISYSSLASDVSPLLTGYVFPSMVESDDIKLDEIESFLYKKMVKAYKDNNYVVTIEDKDLKWSHVDMSDLPLTFSCFCQIFSTENNNPLIYIQGAGGSSAINMLGRFCQGDENIENYVREIADFELSKEDDFIFAEVIHLPEDRIGNVLLRPALLSYEIPYLANSSLHMDHQLPLSDLMISVVNGQVSLRSKKHNKKIIPRLNTAHNFWTNSMPIYHFLGDMQLQNRRGFLGFRLDFFRNNFKFSPRIQYGNIILALTKWTIETEDFTKIIKEKDQLRAIGNWRTENNIPRYVSFSEGDNCLCIDLENKSSVQVLHSAIKRTLYFDIEEFPFDKNNSAIKCDRNESFTNEFVFGFYKNTIKE